MLGEGARVRPPIAAVVEPYPAASREGERLQHVGGDGLVAGAVEGELRALRVGRGLVPQRLEAGHALPRRGGVLVHHARFDGVKETAEPLVGFSDSPVKLGQMFEAPLGALLPPVDRSP